MTNETTGSTRSPAGWARAAGQAAVAFAVGLAIAVAAQLGGATPAAYAVMNTQDGIFCGVPLSRHLEAGATNSFVASLLPGTVASADIIDTANLGVLKMQSVNFSPATGTCGGDLLLTAITDQQMMPLPGTINVTDCFQPAVAHDYTISLSVVSDGPDNCAASLPCGMPLTAGFGVKGEVDSYTFPGQQGDNISFAVTNISPAIGQVRVRLFDPSGTSIYDGFNTNPTCQGSFSTRLPTTGAYTALISSCNGAKNGQYTVTWQPPSCTAKQPPGQFAYVTNADSGTMSVIDLSTNTARLTMPITPQGRAELASPTYVAITPNGGFAWATYGTSSTASVVNTSTNLLMASVPSGLDANGVAISPDGTTAYVVSNSLGGIAVVDTKTNKVTRVVALAEDLGFLQGAATATTQDGTFLYVVSEDEAGLVKINTATYLTEAVTILDPPGLGLYDAFAVSPDASFIYAGTLDGIAVIDTATNSVIKSIAVGEPFAIAFTADGRKAYATIADSQVIAIIDTTTHQAIGSIENVGDSPGGIAISPDTGIAYSTDFTAAANEPGVFVIDTKTNKVITSLPTLGDGPTGIALTTAPTGLCVGDAQGETQVTVDELVLSVNYLLDGCPGQFPSVSRPFP
jgi:YVTN family beta-propeller protein